MDGVRLPAGRQDQEVSCLAGVHMGPPGGRGDFGLMNSPERHRAHGHPVSSCEFPCCLTSGLEFL